MKTITESSAARRTRDRKCNQSRPIHDVHIAEC